MKARTFRPGFVKDRKVYRCTPIFEFVDSDKEDSVLETSLTDSFVTQEEQNERKESKRIRVSLKIQRKRKEVIQREQRVWDCMPFQNLPAECLQINKELKKDSYNELKYRIDRCLNGASQRRIILVCGQKFIGKKTIIRSVMDELRDQYLSSFNQYYLQFQDVQSQAQQQKLHFLHAFLQKIKQKNTIQGLIQTEGIYLKKVDGSESEQLQRSEGLQNHYKGKTSRINTNRESHVFIINGYEQFVDSLKRFKLSLAIRAIMQQIKSIIMIGISNKNQQNPHNLLPELSTRIMIPRNSNEYFSNSLVCAVNGYVYRWKSWVIMKPLASYYTTKLQEQGRLSLLVIRKLISFLQEEGIKSGKQKVGPLIVTRQMMQRFHQRTTSQKRQIDLSQLSIHQKSLLTACYISLKEHQQLLISCESVYKVYSWVCESLSLAARGKKQFYGQILYQLELYKIIKVRSGTGASKIKQILLQVDAEWIRMAYEEEGLFLKFFSPET